MSDFWKDFTYCVKLTFYKPESKQYQMAYVTEVNDDNKTFKWKLEEELKGKTDEIPVFHLTKAVDLMNSMVCNGFVASIQPMFKNKS